MLNQPSTSDDKVLIFISYKHQAKDEKILEELRKYMEDAVQQAGGEFWYDKHIEWGSHWHDQIKEEIQKADIALLLITQEYLSSTYVNNHEISEFLIRRRNEGMLILPLILDHCLWEEKVWLKETQFLPNDPKRSTVSAHKGIHRTALYKQITQQLIEHVKRIAQAKRAKSGEVDHIAEVKTTTKPADDEYQKYFNQGLEKEKLKDYEGAIAAYSTVLIQNPEYSPAYHRRGVVYREKRELEKALADFGKAIIYADIPNFEIYFDRATIRRHMEDLGGAVNDCSEAIILLKKRIEY